MNSKGGQSRPAEAVVSYLEPPVLVLVDTITVEIPGEPRKMLVAKLQLNGDFDLPRDAEQPGVVGRPRTLERPESERVGQSGAGGDGQSRRLPAIPRGTEACAASGTRPTSASSSFRSA